MEEKKSVKINFVGVVSILTLVVMCIGSTFAYFTTSIIGEVDENVTVSSIEVVMNLKLQPLFNSYALLPTNDEDIHKAYKNECLDNYGNGACLAYEITLENLGYEQEGIATFSATSEYITNLKYMIVTENDLEGNYEVLKPATPAMGATAEEQIKDGISVSLGRDDSKKIIIVIWLSNLDEPQDEEQGASFEGQVSFTATSGAKITGTMVENVIIPEN